MLVYWLQANVHVHTTGWLKVGFYLYRWDPNDKGRILPWVLLLHGIINLQHLAWPLGQRLNPNG